MGPSQRFSYAAVPVIGIQRIEFAPLRIAHKHEYSERHSEILWIGYRRSLLNRLRGSSVAITSARGTTSTPLANG